MKIHSGDLGKVDEDGFVYIVGRIKRIEVTYDLFSRSQIKFFPDYIEQLIEKCAGVEVCAVVTVNDKERQRVPVAFVKPITLSGFDLSSLRADFKSKAESYSIPD